MTIIATASDLLPWRGRARQFAVLKEKHLRVLGGWAEVEKAADDLIHELLTVNATPD
jgi:hypothetical protein